jgi:hypothetical protein
VLQSHPGDGWVGLIILEIPWGTNLEPVVVLLPKGVCPRWALRPTLETT